MDTEINSVKCWTVDVRNDGLGSWCKSKAICVWHIVFTRLAEGYTA